MTELEKAVQVASQVRSWAEGRPWDWVCRSTLWGMCAITSARLFSLLKSMNFKSKIRLMGNNSHVFTMVDDWILDVTATQFGWQDPIVLGHVSDMRQESKYFEPSLQFTDIPQLIKWQTVCGWPQDQMVSMEKIEEE